MRESYPYRALARYFECPYWVALCYGDDTHWGRAARAWVDANQTIHTNCVFERHHAYLKAKGKLP